MTRPANAKPVEIVPDPAEAAPLPLSPNLVAFLTSLAFMLVELDAGRLMAWRVGAGLYSWTALIGVMFAGMSVGNWIGGRLADGPRPRRVLGRLLLAGSLATVLLIWVSHVLVLTDTESLRGAGDSAEIPGWLMPLADWLRERFDRPGRLVFTAAMAFVPPALILGMAGPIAAKIAVRQAVGAGRAMGNVYAWGAVGSIVGTLLAGFVLIELLGTRGLLAATAALLAGVGLLVGRQPVMQSAALAVSLAALALSSAGWRWADELGSRLYLRERGRPLYTAEGQYQFVRCDVMAHEIEAADDAGRTSVAVVPDPEFRRLKAAGRVRNKLRELRAMTLDHLFHGYIWLHLPAEARLGLGAADWAGDPDAADRRFRELSTFDPSDLHYGYEHFYAAFTARIAADRSLRGSRPLRTLALGAGAYTFPRFLAAHYPGSTHDVAEIDPAVTRAAEKVLKLDLSAAGADGRPVIRAFHADARNFVEAAGAQGWTYDIVYGDAFTHYSVPTHLTTKDFHDGVRKVLAPGGCYLAMVIDSYESAAFVASYVRTLRETFPYVYLTAARPLKLVRTADAQRTVETIAFDGVAVELRDAAGAVVLQAPAGEVESFRRLASWRLEDRKGRQQVGAEHVRREADGLTIDELMDENGRVVASVPTADVADIRRIDRPAWRLVTADGRVHRGETLTFSGGKATLSGRAGPDGGRESVTVPGSSLRTIREYQRTGRETFVVAASMTPIDLADFGLRPADTAGLRTGDRRTADSVVILSPAELDRLFRRTNAVVLRDEFSPADVMLLPLFRDQEE